MKKIPKLISAVCAVAMVVGMIPAFSAGAETTSEQKPNMGTVDLAMFMGQSNMAGRGEATDAAVCSVGHGYEFRAISDPAKLYNVSEPFGVSENNAESGVNEPGAKTGSMVSSLMETYYSYTGVPMVGVSCSKGGSQISFWQPGTPALNDAVARYNAAEEYLEENGYNVRRKLMVWCQGESDADLSTDIAEYKTMTQSMAQAMIDEGIEKCFMVGIGHKNDTSGKYDAYIEAQKELCNADDRFVMASTKFADNQANMKDLYHYYQSVYNEVGADAGQNIAAFYGDTAAKGLNSSLDIIDEMNDGNEAGITIDGNFTGKVLGAIYDKNERVQQIKIVDESEKAVTVKFDIDSDSNEIKLFNWKNLDEIEPIGEAKSVNINAIKPADSASTTDFRYGKYTSDKYEHSMPYRYYLPKNYDSSKEYPILMYLHGAGRRGNDNVNQLVNPEPLFKRLLNSENIDKYPCIIVAPQCPAGEQWVDTPWGNGTYSIDTVAESDELAMAKDIILEFEKKYSVDTDRVYIAGQSMGGYGTWDMIMRNPTMFAAAIPQCAAGDTTKAESLKTMAIWAHHGDADTTVPLKGSREMVKAIKDAGSTNIRYTQYPGVGHEVQVETFKEPDLLSWLFSKRLSTNAEEKDDYTYLSINNILVREYSGDNIRPVKKDDKVYVGAKHIASELVMTFENNVIAKDDKSLTLNAENSITQNGVVMVDAVALADTFGIVEEFDDISNTLSIKASTQRAGSLQIMSATSSSHTSDGDASCAVDGKVSTRWTALTTTTETANTLTADLGTVRAVEKVAINFYSGNARIYDFDIEVSTDGTNYSKIKTFASSGNTNGFEDFVFDEAVNARYVRYVGRGSKYTSNGAVNVYNSIWEFEVYGSEEPIDEPEPQVFKKLVIESATGDQNVNGDGVGAVAQAYDGEVSDTSRWAADTAAKGQAVLTFDLGQKRCVSAFDIAFYASQIRKYDFDINVSNDGSRWKTVGTFESNGATANMSFERFEIEPVNTSYIQFVGRGSTINGLRNTYSTFYEFEVYGYDNPEDNASNAPSLDDANITVTRDDANTTYDSIGLKWTYDGDDPDDVKYYRVERVMDGITEFKTDGEVSSTSYVDNGSAKRPQYGPYEVDYTINLDGKYYVADQGNQRALLSDAGKTTFVYESYEGIPLVSGGEYGYIVTGYNASGELVAKSELTKLKTKEKENTASMVFTGEPSTKLEGYNMSVSTVTSMELSEYGGIPAWHFVASDDESIVNKNFLGLKFDDNSGLIGAEEDTGYLVKITWGDRFFNSAAAVRMNMQRTANELYNTSNYADVKNYVCLDAGSGVENKKWFTREIAYYGKNNHSININNVLSDLMINGFYAGKSGRFYIKSIEVSKWDGPEVRPFQAHMPTMFTDDMIIQRDKDINVWGRLDGTPKNEDGTYKAAEVTVSLYDESNTLVAQNSATAAATRQGDWTVTLPGQAYTANKSYTLKIKAKADGTESDETVINNIIFGDVYLCSGQSNMRYGYEYTNWTDYRADVDAGAFNNDNVRIISNENSTQSNYWETNTVGWKKSSTESIVALKFSATASYFGKHLYAGNGNIPVGLISSAVGGASIETFLVNPVYDASGNKLYTGNSALYKRLIYPYTNHVNTTVGKGTQLAGIIWYQGEADANTTKFTMPTYTKAMEQMVTDYRTVFGDESLPFMYVQLAAFDNPSGEYAAMREAQLNYMIGRNTNNGKPVNVGMAVITDNTDNIRDIHPRNKTEVGRRLSLWARKLVYNDETVEYTGPIVKEVIQTEYNGKEALKITFEDYSVMNGIALKDNTLQGMTIAGSDKSFAAPTGYELTDDNKSIVVWNDSITAPEYVNYGYYKLPTDASIFNADGLPASAFRNYED